MHSEQAITFSVGDEQLLSILHDGASDNETGVIIIVGGPQYRVGSHRQFTQLARHLSSEGIHTLRFDYRGMGDSQGTKQAFDQVDNDINAAINTLIAERPQIKRVILWGLCDAASAALIYGYQDDRVKGLVLLNPWLKNDQAQAKTMVKHYYIQRLLSFSFWKKLFLGQVNLSKSAKEAKGYVKDSVTKSEQPQTSYQQRMLDGLNHFNGNICLVLSGDDLTAKEFEQQGLHEKPWLKFKGKTCQIKRLAQADHTFSSAQYKREVEQITAAFVNEVEKSTCL